MCYQMLAREFSIVIGEFSNLRCLMNNLSVTHSKMYGLLVSSNIGF